MPGVEKDSAIVDDALTPIQTDARAKAVHGEAEFGFELRPRRRCEVCVLDSVCGAIDHVPTERRKTGFDDQLAKLAKGVHAILSDRVNLRDQLFADRFQIRADNQRVRYNRDQAATDTLLTAHGEPCSRQGDDRGSGTGTQGHVVAVRGIEQPIFADIRFNDSA